MGGGVRDIGSVRYCRWAPGRCSFTEQAAIEARAQLIGRRV